MIALKVLLTLTLVSLGYGGFSMSSSSSGNDNYSYDLSKEALTDLYNSRVQLLEKMRRPLDGCQTNTGLLTHTGVRVTLMDGSRWLIHKGHRFGYKGGDTVVVDARHMSNRWKVEETKDIDGSRTISELVEVGGPVYDFLFQNCHHATENIMALG